MNPLLSGVGRWLAHFLTQPIPTARPIATSPPELLAQTLQPCDILLVEGNTRISTAIKYLTQSTWSHAALYVGPKPDWPKRNGAVVSLLEADLNEGVRMVPLSEYDRLHTRICRPVGLNAQDRAHVMDYAIRRLGHRYDLKNVFDLARYVLHTPPVPLRWRRRMLALGSGDPTRAICSTLIAQAFQSVRYPILPEVVSPSDSGLDGDGHAEMLHIRHYSLFAPRDFDVSPYFAVVKPRLEKGFDPYAVHWADTTLQPGADRSEPVR